MLRSILILMILTFSILGKAQKSDSFTSSTSFNLSYSLNLSNSSAFKSQSIAGSQGVSLEHRFSELLGFNLGVFFTQINIGRQEGYVNPNHANNFKFLETPFELKLYPFEDLNNLNFNIGFSVVQLMDISQGHVPDLEYNYIFYNFSAEYHIKTKSSLTLAAGLRYQYFDINKDLFGNLSLYSLFFKLGLKK